jgi:hypothetical protein
LGRRTGDFAQRLCAKVSGAGCVGVEVDSAGRQVATARKGGLIDTAGVRLRKGLRCGLTRRDVGDLGVPRRAGVGVGNVRRVIGCTHAPSHRGASAAPSPRQY